MGNGEIKHILVALDESGGPKKDWKKQFTLPNYPVQKLHA